MKKCIFLLIIAFIVGCHQLSAQTSTGKSEYFFDEFTEAIVQYYDGRRFVVDINYNFVDRCFVFYDRVEKDVIKIFAKESQVGLIKVGDRNFRISSRNYPEEIIRPEPYLSVEYVGRTKPAGKRSGYGGRSETSAIQTYNSIATSGMVRNLEGDRMLLIGVSRVYHIQKGGKNKSFLDEAQFLKIYPKQKETLKRYMEENPIDFDNGQQVMQLCDFAASLP